MLGERYLDALRKCCDSVDCGLFYRLQKELITDTRHAFRDLCGWAVIDYRTNYDCDKTRMSSNGHSIVGEIGIRHIILHTQLSNRLNYVIVVR